MRIFRDLGSIDPAGFGEGSVVAIGKFDGVHLGHRAILDRVGEAAGSHGLASAVFTFTNNPLSQLMPESCPSPLMSPEQRLEQFEAAGLDVCAMVDFDAALAAMPADEFIAEILVERLRARRVCLGGDFRFGHLGVGDADLLRARGAEHGFAVEVVDWVTVPGFGQVSSSRIREAVLAGEIEAAAAMLGRPPAVRGEVVRGDARGRELGFPTANLGGRVEGLVPLDGVYAGWAEVPGGVHPAAISVGNNPTFTPDGQSRVEPYLLDFEGDLYGLPIEVRFISRLRGMERFDSIDALVEQMRADVDEARSLLESA